MGDVQLVSSSSRKHASSLQRSGSSQSKRASEIRNAMSLCGVFPCPWSHGRVLSRWMVGMVMEGCQFFGILGDGS